MESHLKSRERLRGEHRRCTEAGVERPRRKATELGEQKLTERESETQEEERPREGGREDRGREAERERDRGPETERVGTETWEGGHRCRDPER